jgi:hypothetical protein
MEYMITAGLWTESISMKWGTFWEFVRYGVTMTCAERGKKDGYQGNFAKEEWAKLGCSGKLPVEADGASGTACSHWEEQF